MANGFEFNYFAIRKIIKTQVDRSYFFINSTNEHVWPRLFSSYVVAMVLFDFFQVLKRHHHERFL